MLLREAMERQGNRFFRWRSALPLLGLPVAALAASQVTASTWGRTWDLVWAASCLIVSLSGQAIRALTTGYASARTSGRNTRKGQVADALNTRGMYSIVRNPLYVGNFLMGLGVVLFLRVPWFAGLYVLAFLPYYERIIFAEEAFLQRKFGERYKRWADRTPVCIPRPSLWRAPATGFDVRRMIRKEYLCLCILLLVFVVLKGGRDLLLGRGIVLDPVWIGLGLVAVVLFATHPDEAHAPVPPSGLPRRRRPQWEGLRSHHDVAHGVHRGRVHSVGAGACEADVRRRSWTRATARATPRRSAPSNSTENARRYGHGPSTESTTHAASARTSHVRTRSPGGLRRMASRATAYGTSSAR